jgi:hypothetical protein
MCMNTFIVANDSGFEVTFPDAIPLVELFGIIEHHWTFKGKILRLKQLLDDRTY